MHAQEIGVRQAGIARRFRPARHQHGVVFGDQLREGHGDADVLPVVEGHPFRLHLLHPAVDMLLLHLEVGDAVAQQAASLGLALIDMDIVPDAGELLRRGHAGGAGTHDGDALAGAPGRDLRRDPAFFPALVGDRLLDRLDRHRHVFEVERAGLLAGRGADAAGEFREVVGGVEVAQRRLPTAGIDQLVPVRNLVVHRAAGRPVAERNAAIHAARRLLLDVALLQRERELAEMPDAVAGELILLLLPVVFEEARDLAHAVSLAVCPGSPARVPDPDRVTGAARAPVGGVLAYSAACKVRACSISRSARRYSTGITLTNLVR